MLLDYYDHPDGITTIDAAYLQAGVASIHMIQQGGEIGFVDTGTTHSLPIVLEVLRKKALRADDVQYVIVTHVHLDHAGGAGAMMREFTNARLVVHPRGARHMIDPGKLVAGTIGVYGSEATHRLYGEVYPVPESRVLIAEDGFELDFNGRPLHFIDVPGHARHHFGVLDLVNRNLFSGDTMGISYREFDNDGAPFLFPTTPPVQFEPEALHDSIIRLMETRPRSIFLTHFGRISPTPQLIAGLHRHLDAYVDIAQRLKHEPDRCARLVDTIGEYLYTEAKRHGPPLTDEDIRKLLAGDVLLNAQGIHDWLEKGAPRPSGSGKRLTE